MYSKNIFFFLVWASYFSVYSSYTTFFVHPPYTSIPSALIFHEKADREWIWQARNWSPSSAVCEVSSCSTLISRDRRCVTMFWPKLALFVIYLGIFAFTCAQSAWSAPRKHIVNFISLIRPRASSINRIRIVIQKLQLKLIWI